MCQHVRRRSVLALFWLGGLFVLASRAGAYAQSQTSNEPPENREDEMLSYEEVVVVSVSKLQERLINAPAAVSIVAASTIESSAAQNYGDLLGKLPGINVVQLSARDINIASRAQNGALVTSQLALVDGRTVYQDFFGFVSWDLLPIQMSEIEQIEVIRGPVSAVWGANAMTGIVNVITKSPRQMEGTTMAIGFGAIDRSVEGSDLESGLLFSLNATHARVVNDRSRSKSQSVLSHRAHSRAQQGSSITGSRLLIRRSRTRAARSPSSMFDSTSTCPVRRRTTS